ncbi:hypothetical protein DAERI_030202 [Deinococcus aerius]|uniref:Uncharacterized protein n=1 Tax=Deinococcus aerius TaxID=200253 RepID=A0A2I9D3A9_9DEIO|nr:DUF6683 family protein [Deinococcus aerius]GBF05036.1 hypothetical protein DAERI_030202 [Deinococcus aerius]
MPRASRLLLPLLLASTLASAQVYEGLRPGDPPLIPQVVTLNSLGVSDTDVYVTLFGFTVPDLTFIDQNFPGVVARGNTAIRAGKASTTFAPGRSNAPGEIAARVGGSLQVQGELRGRLEQALAGYPAIAEKLGLSTTDFADTLTFAVAAFTLVASDGRKDLSDAEVAGLRADMRARLLRNKGFQGLTFPQRQHAHDYLVLLGLIVLDAYQTGQASGDAATAEQAVQNARAHIRRLLGAEFERVQFTPKGVVIR